MYLSVWSFPFCRVLHGRGYYAVAAGFQTAGDALSVLAEWADKILVLDGAYVPYVQKWVDKVVVIHVGRDRWSNPYHPELLELLGSLVDANLKLAKRVSL